MLCARTRGSSWVSRGGKLRIGRIGGVYLKRPGSALDCSVIGEREREREEEGCGGHGPKTGRSATEEKYIVL
jgi:hypothetical protein